MVTGGFFAVAERDPDRRALVDPDERVFTYGALAGRANSVARGLRDRGVTPGKTVAVMMHNRVELLEVYAAAVQIGACVVIVNWHLLPDEVAYILGDAAAVVLVVDGACATTSGAAADRAGVAAGARFCTEPHPGFAPFDALAAGNDEGPLDDRVAGQVMFYTSGTTGRPKGVRKRFGTVAADQVGLATAIGLLEQAPFDPAIED